MSGRSLKAVMNSSNPNHVADAMRTLKFGNYMQAIPAQMRVAVASNVTSLPDGLNAAAALRVYATKGTATGLFTQVASGPATTQFAIGPTGQIVFAGADAVTEAEIVVVPHAGDLVEEVVSINGSGVGTLGAGKVAKIILEAEVLSGAASGTKTIIAREGSPSAGEAALNDDGTEAVFNVAAASVTARVKYIASPAENASPAEALVTDQQNL